MELEIPENNDEGVKKALRELNGKLRVDLMKNLLQEVGDLLYLATNATAKDADQQIKVQNTLFTALKLCDAWNLMLTSFKIGASDINEKLYIAYLKLLDGFPDFALDDVKSVTTHVSSMKAACKKAEGTFTEAKQELTECIQSLKEDEEKMEHGAKKAVDSYRHAINELRETYKSGFGIIEQWWDVDPAYQARLSEARKAYVDQSVKIPVCTIAKKALELALPKYHDAIGFLEKIESLVEDWYHECREVVEKQMKSNVKQAGKMSEAAQKEFWKPLPFTEEAFRYLCRWKALQLICQSTAVHLRRVRSAIDLYYTENPYPNEAIKKAWELKEKYDSLKSVEKFRDMAVPEAERNELVCCLSKLMQLEDQHNLYKDVANEMGKLEEVTAYTTVLKSVISGDTFANVVREMSQKLNTFSNLLLNIPTKLSYYSFQNLLNVHFATLSVLDGLPDAAATEIEKIRNHTPKCTSDDDLHRAINLIADHNFHPKDQMKELQENLSVDVNQMLTALDETILAEERAAPSEDTSTFKKLAGVVKRIASPTPHVKPNEIATYIKFHKLSIEVLQVLMKKLPLGDFKDHLSTINTEYLCRSSTTAEEELMAVVDALKNKQIRPEQRGQAWQNGIFEILNRLKDVHLGSQRQINAFNITKNQEEGRRSWQEYKSRKWTMWDTFIAKCAEKIDENVDTEVHASREKAQKLIKIELEEERQRKEEERRRKEEKRRRKEEERRRQEEEQEEAKRKRVNDQHKNKGVEDRKTRKEGEPERNVLTRNEGNGCMGRHAPIEMGAEAMLATSGEDEDGKVLERSRQPYSTSGSSEAAGQKGSQERDNIESSLEGVELSSSNIPSEYAMARTKRGSGTTERGRGDQPLRPGEDEDGKPSDTAGKTGRRSPQPYRGAGVKETDPEGSQGRGDTANMTEGVVSSSPNVSPKRPIGGKSRGPGTTRSGRGGSGRNGGQRRQGSEQTKGLDYSARQHGGRGTDV